MVVYTIPWIRARLELRSINIDFKLKSVFFFSQLLFDITISNRPLLLLYTTKYTYGTSTNNEIQPTAMRLLYLFIFFLLLTFVY